MLPKKHVIAALCVILICTSLPGAFAEHSITEVLPALAKVCETYYPEGTDCAAFSKAAKEYHKQSGSASNCLSESAIEDMEFYAHTMLRLEHVNSAISHPISKNDVQKLVKFIGDNKKPLKLACEKCRVKPNCDSSTDFRETTISGNTFKISFAHECDALDIQYNSVGDGAFKSVDLKIRTDAVNLVAKSQLRNGESQDMEDFEREKELLKGLDASARENYKKTKDNRFKFGLVEFLGGSPTAEQKDTSWYETRGYKDGQVYTYAKSARGKAALKKENEFASLVYQIACGLEQMHNEDIVHRDVKPENIVAENGRYALIDFGFSKKSNAVTDVEGSATFLPPEIGVKGNLNFPKQHDTYSFAASLYDLLLTRDGDGTEIPVWDRKRGQVEVLKNLGKEEQFKKLDVDPRIKKLILRGLSPLPKDRPSITEFRKAAEILLGPEFIAQIPGPQWLRPTKTDFRQYLGSPEKLPVGDPPTEGAKIPQKARELIERTRREMAYEHLVTTMKGTSTVPELIPSKSDDPYLQVSVPKGKILKYYDGTKETPCNESTVTILKNGIIQCGPHRIPPENLILN